LNFGKFWGDPEILINERFSWNSSGRKRELFSVDGANFNEILNAQFDKIDFKYVTP